MQLKIQLEETPKHNDVATCTTWNSLDEVFSCGDDHKLFLWNITKKNIKKVLDLPEDLYPITIAWPPKGPPIVGPNKKNYDILLITASDGRLYLMGRGGRMEKVIQAHTGAILSSSWSPDGSEILTSGEDGSIRIWSRNGSLRSTLAQLSAPIYASAWSPDGHTAIYSNGNNLVLKSTSTGLNSKYFEWEAHNGIILCLGWSINANIIVSGSEDCKYKLWSSDGVNLFTSVAYEHPITSIGWAPNGNVFAVGSYKTLRLCSRYGWSHFQEEDINVGSIYNIQWSPDSSQFTGACAGGQILLATIANHTISWRNYEANLETSNSVTIAQFDKSVRDRLDFRERVLKVEMDQGYLMIVTLSQVYVYQVSQIATPAICDISEHGVGSVSFIVQTQKSFLVVGGNIITIWSYNGTKTGTCKYPALRPSHLRPEMISLTTDLIAIIDQADIKQVQLFDPDGGITSGKSLGHVEMKCPIIQVALSKHEYLRYSERILAIIDSNQDLFITFLRRSTNLQIETPIKLDTAARAGIWHNEACILAVVRDVKLRVYYLPQILYMDMVLLDDTWEDKDIGDLGRMPQLLSYDVNRIELCKPDGTIVYVLGNPYVAHLHLDGLNGQIEKAHRIARYVNNKIGWAVFAAICLWKGELHLAEIGFAEIGHNDKVLFIQAVKEVEDPVSKKAQIQLLRGRLTEAETILLSAGRVGEAINVHIQTHNWSRALELSLKAKENLPVLFEARAAYLKNLELKAEHLPSFIETAKQLKQLMSSSGGKKKKVNNTERTTPNPKAKEKDVVENKENGINNRGKDKDSIPVIIAKEEEESTSRYLKNDDEAEVGEVLEFD